MSPPTGPAGNGCPYCTVSQAAELLGVSRTTIWRWIAAGKLPASKAGRRTTRIRRQDLEGLMAPARPRQQAAGGPALGRREQLLDLAHDAILLLDLDNCITFWNRGAEALYGWGRDEALGKVAYELLRTQFPVSFAATRATLEATGLWEGELEQTRRDGGAIVVLSRWALERDRAGRPTAILEINRDITERKRAERERARLAAIVESSDDAIISKTLEAVITSWNAGAERIYGYRADEVIGQPIAILVPQDRPDELPSIMARLRRGERIEHYETERIRKDGRRISVSVTISPIRESDGRVIGASAIARDVSARKRHEADQRFLAEAGAALGASIDYQATLRTVARLAAGYLADWSTVHVRRDDDTIERLALVHADPARQELARRFERYPSAALSPRSSVAMVLQTGRPTLVAEVPDAYLRAIAADPEHLEAFRQLGFRSLIAVPLLARGRILGALALISGEPGRYGPEDLGLAEELGRRAGLAVDHARLYGEARAATRMRDEFISIASHELRTPLTTLQAHAQLALRRFEREDGLDPSRVIATLETINVQSDKLSRLIGQLLDISRLEAGKLSLEREPTDLRRLAEAVAAGAQARTSRHQLTVRGSTGLEALVDPLRLEQALTNLLDNAIKYSPDGGAVEVELSRSPDGLAEIAVRDHGIGIPPDRRSQIFERFYQAHRPGHARGMGLGLYVSRQIVELHGGQLAAEFPEDGGSRFIVRLPMGPSGPSA